MSVIAMTGASGRIGTNIRPLLAAAGHTVRLLDLAEPEHPALDNETFDVLDSTDERASAEAFRGSDLVVHLAALSGEASWNDVSRVNFDGARATHEAARLAGVRRVLAASSVHAAGFLDGGTARNTDTPLPRPDTFYGVSKVLLEALGSLYADRFGQTVVSARIMTAEAEPSTERSLSTWLSPADTVRLVEAALALDEPGHHVVWGVSDNTRRVVSLDAGRRIGYRPVDDAEVFAHRFPDARPLDDPDPSVRLGGTFPEWPLGKKMA